MKVAVTKIVKFSMAHKLESAYSKECTNIHGHNYTLEATFSCSDNDLNKDGMVIDFKLIKEILHPLIKEYDHKCITKESFGYNPTAENMAIHIFAYLKNVTPLIDSVKLWETDSGFCTVSHN